MGKDTAQNQDPLPLSVQKKCGSLSIRNFSQFSCLFLTCVTIFEMGGGGVI